MRLIVCVAATLLAVTSPGCSTNPATGHKQLNILSTSREITVGSQAAPGFIQEYGGPIPSAKIQAYVSSLGQRLAATSERADLPWEFTVLNSPAVNAFALPGGKVFITRGLLAKLTNEAQLAGVLGHEIGHVTAQHIGQQMTRALLLQTGVIGIGLANKHTDSDWLKILGVGAEKGGAVYLLKFGRDQESESDTLGLRYMTQAGYSPIGQLQVMEILAAGSSDTSKLSEILATHPLPKTRIRELEKQIQENYPDHDNPSYYRFNIDQFKAIVLDELEQLPPLPSPPPSPSQDSQPDVP